MPDNLKRVPPDVLVPAIGNVFGERDEFGEDIRQEPGLAQQFQPTIRLRRHQQPVEFHRDSLDADPLQLGRQLAHRGTRFRLDVETQLGREASGA